MKFVKSEKIESVVFNKSAADFVQIFGVKKINFPSDELYSGVIYGRIKGTGVSLKGLETQALVTTPKEVVIYGKEGRVVWRKPLKGLKASNQALDAVKVTASDRESVNFIVGMPIRPRMIQHLSDASNYSIGLVAGAIVLDQVTGEISSSGSISQGRDEIDSERVRDFVEEVGENLADEDEESEGADEGYSYDDGGDFDF
jgi:hypothetical protein